MSLVTDLVGQVQAAVRDLPEYVAVTGVEATPEDAREGIRVELVLPEYPTRRFAAC